MPEITRVLTVVGDPNRIGTWSGAPYFFLKAGKEQGFLSCGLPLRPEDLRRRRLLWNLARLGRGARPGGFQYTDAFLRPLFGRAGLGPGAEIEIVSHFPLLPPRPWPRAWRVSYYIDATLQQNFVDYGLAARVNPKVLEDALRRERAHYHAAERVVCMSRWAARSVVEHYGVPSSRVPVILPGANLEEAALAPPASQAGAAPLVPLRLGFIGKDWRRKGLPFLLQVADALARRSVPVRVVALGPPAADLPSHPLLESAGFLDKQHEAERFVRLVRSFHFSCLFSSAEASAISNIECLRLGVPVLASRVGGIPEAARDGLAYLFEPDCPPLEVADLLESFVRDPAAYHELRARVLRSAPEFSWRRTVERLIALWGAAGSLAA
jgi:glycosyltransferase involved in cell wall biosynthesis